jgi:hypothetical protein
MEHEFKLPLQIEWVVDAGPPWRVTPRRQSRPVGKPNSNRRDYDDQRRVVIVVDSAAGHLITEMFPGAEEVT